MFYSMVNFRYERGIQFFYLPRNHWGFSKRPRKANCLSRSSPNKPLSFLGGHMARSRYEFIKIEQRLFNDPRFYMLNEFEQLTYIKLVSLMKQTKNKIPKDFKAIGLYFRTNRSESEVKSAVNRIKKVFHNFNENKYFYYFDGYTERYEYGGVEEDKEKEKEKELFIPINLEERNKVSKLIQGTISNLNKNGRYE